VSVAAGVGEWVVATSNAGKVKEFATLLEPLGFTLRALTGLAPVDFPEEGDEYAANAIAKARAVSEGLGRAALADDSGLEVDALGGAPGPLSARYGGPGLDDEGRVRHLLGALVDVPAERRGARFVCVAAAAVPGGPVLVWRGECPGRILSDPRQGEGGFGYDPVFVPEGHERSMAELGAAQKDEISHRGRAFRGLARLLLADDAPIR
jgi:XTP/dITP diphosphohydrolase